MAFRLEKNIIKGEIDNRLRDYVMGKLWLVGRDEPIRLSLKGNCLRDIAGLRLLFENPTPEARHDEAFLDSLQEGVVGDMTASRKVKILKMPVEEAYRLRQEGKDVPLHTANSIYLEWFTENNGRVVIESATFRVKTLSEPEWRMSADEEREQMRANRSAIRDYISSVSEERDVEQEEEDDEPYEPMDEFEWEKGLRESDEVTDRYCELLDLYMDHPDRERIIAREMGWTWLDDALDADERGAFDDLKEDPEDLPEMDPNPTTEGRDWIRTEDGRVKHPLSNRAFETSMNMWHYCHDLGLEEKDADLHDMLFQAQVLGAKLAGALDSLAYDHHPEGGFVVACLKRALQYFDNAMSAADRVRKKKLLEADRLQSFLEDLFAIREEMLGLMKHYRHQP